MLTKPGEISGNMNVPKPVIATQANWLAFKEPVDPVKRQRMKEFLT